MLYHSLQMTSTRRQLPDRYDMLAVGDIIRWPLSGDPEGCVLIVETDAIAGCWVLSVVPGLVERGQPLRTGTLRLSESEARRAGLPCRMRFELELRISLAPRHRVLSTAQGSPVIGRLSGSLLEQLSSQRARIHALGEVAAARREVRRAQSRSDRRTGWRIAAGTVVGSREGRK